ncbi:MAG: HAD family hydrolase [Nitrososphaeria archaeon]
MPSPPGSTLDLARAARARRIEAVLLDMDGTILEYIIDYELGRARALRRIREAVPGADAVEIAARSAREIVRSLGAALGERAASVARRIIFEEYEAVEVEAARRVEPRPGAIDALEELRASGYRVALVTNNSRRAVGLIASRFPRMMELLDAVVTRDDSMELKPGASGLRMALQALGVPGERSVMAGDTPSDVRAGRSVGALTVGIEGGAASAGDLLEAGAEFIVSSPRELSRALRIARHPGSPY